jgi:hypothetical protein
MVFFLKKPMVLAVAAATLLYLPVVEKGGGDKG